jgi:hypothetical protein
MVDRALLIVELRERFIELMKYIADTTLTEEFLDPRIDSAICRALPEILSDENKRADNAEFLGRVDEIRTFMRERPAVIYAAQ